MNIFYDALLEDIIYYYKKNINSKNFINTEKSLESISKKYNGKIVDAYCSIMLNINGEDVFIPNTYGQEDQWKQNEFDIVLVFKDKFIFIRGNINDHFDYLERLRVPTPFDFNLDDFGGKRAYYLEDEHLRLRTSPEFIEGLSNEQLNSLEKHFSFYS